MKTCKKCGDTKPLSEYYRHKTSSDGYRSDCKKCHGAAAMRRHFANHETRKQQLREAHAKKVAANPNYHAESYAANRDKSLTLSKDYYRRNAETCIEKQKQWAVDNPDKVRQYKKNWKQKHVGAVREHTVRRRLNAKQQTPAWANAERIKGYYDVCAFFNEVNGFTKYHVDHIIPLRGKRVSGLHIHTNLRVIPARENERKNNKFEVA